MDLGFLLKGLLLGFSIAAPVGPIGILCIRKTLEYGRLSGFISGIGAAVADTIYGMVAAFGLTLISDFLLSGQLWLRLIGGGFLVYLGVKTFLAKPAKGLHQPTHKTLASDFLTTFALTMTNPMTIFSFLAVFAGLGLEGSGNSEALWLVGGVFLGSALWWLLLSQGVSLFRTRVTPATMTWINRSAGLFITLFGLVVWLTIFR